MKNIRRSIVKYPCRAVALVWLGVVVVSVVLTVGREAPASIITVEDAIGVLSILGLAAICGWSAGVEAERNRSE